MAKTRVLLQCCSRCRTMAFYNLSGGKLQHSTLQEAPSTLNPTKTQSLNLGVWHRKNLNLENYPLCQPQP